jgi:hypothetical protein
MSSEQGFPEKYKDLAYAMKDQQIHHDKNVNQKILKILRDLDKRIAMLENKKTINGG